MSRSEILLKSVQTFFDDDENVKHLHDILEKRNGISLRNLEWFITNYSKNNNLTYKTDNGDIFTVHCSYKSSLDGYSKKLFDPFCRTEKIVFKPHNKNTINTTVAQLNFIRWCIKNNIIHYINQHKHILKKKSQPPQTHH